MRVNFNYEASVTHTAYLTNQREMGKSLLRLSTGMRILEAADDAAGLFIADQLSVVATGLQEGNRNISTGISALRIAENAAGQIFDRLRGIYARAIRAANDINDPNARTALQREVNNLVDAIQKIGTDTEYNGMKLLDGTFVGKYIHYGPRMDQVVNVSIADVRAQSLGAYIAQGLGATRTTAGTFTSGGTLANLLGSSGALGDAASADFRLDSGDYVRINGATVYQNTSTTEKYLVDAATLARI
jgi:flagellin